MRIRLSPAHPQRGSILIEFALVVLLLSVLLAATVELGKAVYFAQAAQNAARVAARELALAPLPPQATFDEALATVFDPALLYVDLDATSIDAAFANAPALNHALKPLMIFDRVTVGGSTHEVLRYPGAVWVRSGGVNTVKVPLVVSRGADGVETIELRDVVEAIPGIAYAVDPSAPNTSGIAAVRVHVPFQAAALSGFQANAAGPFEPNLDGAIVADDAGVTVSSAPGDGALAGAGSELPTYAGPYGLGRQYALGKELRPFRKLITGQSLFRREVFANP
ncbi:MAG: pilus assembly protein [Planctomycetes bacterium]|nr:pilus assembly protein [Planctomycetota bacterium]